MSGKTTQDDFNPRSREGSDIVYSTGLTMSNKISIHAPAKGATETKSLASEWLEISIHAPAKGATLQLSTLSTKTIFQSTLPRRERRKIDRLCSLRSYFNPRSREGSDTIFFPCSFITVISIHAPAKGATMLCAGYPPLA